MKVLRNNLLAGFIICLMFASIIGSTLISYKAEKRLPTGKSIQQGQVTLTVGGTTPVTETTTTGGGGGGGVAVEETPSESNLDFSLENTYTITPSLGTLINVIFSEDIQYTFDVVELTDNKITFKIQGNQYTITISEIGYFDLDSDGNDDLKITYDGKYLTLASLYLPEKENLPPKLTIHKIVSEIPVISGTGGLFNYIILIALIIITFFILIYQHHKFASFEKKYKLVKKGKSLANKKTFDKNTMLIDKLNGQKEVLKKAYLEKHISKKAYDVSINRIEFALREIKRK